MTDNIWYPYTQHATAPTPVTITKSEGIWLETEKGNLMDLISSWWVNPYGHNHPVIMEAIRQQTQEIDHVIMAGFNHPKALELSERIFNILPIQSGKCFFSDNGSTSVEVAMKMAIQHHFNQNPKTKKKKILAFEGAYHGDTFGAMSAGARGKFFIPFEDHTFEVFHLPTPREDKKDLAIDLLKKEAESGEYSCFIFEPLLQGAGGMNMYSAEHLNLMLSICKQNDIICIADEVMTGFGRTGKNFACEYLSETPDIICLSKGLTAGVLPMSLTVATDRIFESFLSEDNPYKTLFHGHSYTGNPFGCAIAVAGLDILQSSETQIAIANISSWHEELLAPLKNHPKLRRVESLGTVSVMEVNSGKDNDYFDQVKTKLYPYFLENECLIRPMGNVLYLMPPYCITKEQLTHAYKILTQSLELID